MARVVSSWTDLRTCTFSFWAKMIHQVESLAFVEATNNDGEEKKKKKKEEERKEARYLREVWVECGQHISSVGLQPKLLCLFAIIIAFQVVIIICGSWLGNFLFVRFRGSLHGLSLFPTSLGNLLGNLLTPFADAFLFGVVLSWSLFLNPIAHAEFHHKGNEVSCMDLFFVKN